MRRLAFVGALCTLALAGCGGGSTPKPSPTPRPAPPLLRGPQSCIPPEGAGTPGVCAQPTKNAAPKGTAPCAAKRDGKGKTCEPLKLSGAAAVPDVSYYQGRPDWTAAKAWGIAGAVVRVADGNFNDPAFSYNWLALKRLNLWHAAYYFLRPYNCAGQADRALGLIAAQGGLDSGPLVADAEVPLNYGCALAFVAEVEHRTGWHVRVIYSAAGTWPGGPHDGALAWDAAYGPTPGCPWSGCHRVAWQCTDGIYGCVTRIPGIGRDDVSRDEGLLSIRRVDQRALKARIRTLHRVLQRYGCRRREHAHERLGPRCRRWKREGDEAHARLGS